MDRKRNLRYLVIFILGILTAVLVISCVNNSYKLSHTVNYLKTEISEKIREKKDFLVFKTRLKSGKIKTIYKDGEEQVSKDKENVININGVECYVLKYEKDKALLITKDIYDIRFEDKSTSKHKGASELNSKEFDSNNYELSTLRKWMASFYSDELKSYNKIIPTDVNYYTSDYLSDDIESFECHTIENEMLFPIDGIEAKTYSHKFKNSNRIKKELFNHRFWTTANYSFSGRNNVYSVTSEGKLEGTSSTSPSVGARPVFWISLK